MTCTEVQDRILEALDRRGVAGFEPHLETCEACRAFHQRHAALDAALRGALIPPPLPRRFEERVLERTSQAFDHWLRRAEMAACVALAVAVALVFGALPPEAAFFVAWAAGLAPLIAALRQAGFRGRMP